MPETNKPLTWCGKIIGTCRIAGDTIIGEVDPLLVSDEEIEAIFDGAEHFSIGKSKE